MKKIKAYTLVEISVVIIISGIVMAFAISTFLKTSKISTSLKEKQQQEIETLLFYGTIKVDFLKAQFPTYYNRRLILNNNKTNKLVYEFSSEYVIRQSIQRQDTFWLKVNNINMKKDAERHVYEASFVVSHAQKPLFFRFCKDEAYEYQVNKEILQQR